MDKKKLIRPILLATLAILIIIQFFQIDKVNPPVTQSQDFIQVTNPPAEVANLLKVACYDCHSYTTKYPWYTNIQPVAWWIKGHVDNGNKKLNYSIWNTYDTKKKIHKIEEMIEVTEEKRMPLLSYMVAHQEGWLDENQRKILVDWFKTLE